MREAGTTDVQSARGTAETLQMNEEFQILREVKHWSFIALGLASMHPSF